MAWHCISDILVREVQDLIHLQFSDHFIHNRTGLSRDVIKQIRAGKYRTKKRDRKPENDINRPRSAETIRREAQEALVQAGRQSVKLLDHNGIS